MKYIYETHSIGYVVSTKKLTEKIQQLLEDKARDGWRLVQMDCCDSLGACILIFEKEDTLL